MKVLFTTFPAYGHLLPMIPLARAVAARGDQAVVIASPELHGACGDLAVRALGPTLPDLLAANERRHGQDVLDYRSDSEGAAGVDDLIEATVALFTTTRADLAFDELAEVFKAERPDLVVAEMWDYAAPLVAQRLGIPWATFVHSPATPVDELLAQGLSRAAAQRGLAAPSPLATVQMWPEWLDPDQSPAGGETVLPIGTAPYDTTPSADIPAFNGDRPVVLITLGTVVTDMPLLNSAVAAVLDAGADALVTTGFTAGPDEVKGDPDQVHAVSFAPIGQLLDRVQAVVTAGGSGTTLAALSRGLPLAFLPRIANQPLVASVVAGFGAGTVCAEPAELTAAVHTMLDQSDMRTRAEAASDLLNRRPTPEAVWSALRQHVG